MTPFDRAIELHELHEAQDTYAWGHGEPGSPAYRAAWFRFQQHVKTIEDLQRLRRSAATRRRQGKARRESVAAVA